MMISGDFLGALRKLQFEARQPVSVGCHSPEAFFVPLFCRVDVDAVQVELRLLAGYRKAGFLDQAHEIGGREAKPVWQTPRGHLREVLMRQAGKFEADISG